MLTKENSSAGNKVQINKTIIDQNVAKEMQTPEKRTDGKSHSCWNSPDKLYYQHCRIFGKG